MAKTYGEKPTDIHANNLHVLKERIKNGSICGCYTFYGDEEYLKEHYTKQLLSASESSLNITSFYSSEFTLPDFLSACQTSAVENLDMFSMDDEQQDNDAFRVIKIYSPDLSSLSKSDADYLIDFLSAPSENTIVIFWFYAGDDEAINKGLMKKICENSLTVNFKREPVGSSVLLTWIIRHFSKEKINIDRYIALHICQTVGNSMTELRCEITKLIDFLKFENRDTLEKKDVDYICIKSMEAQIFDISNGALSGDFPKAARSLQILRDKKEKPILILGTITKAVNQLCMTEKYIKSGMQIPAIAKNTKTPEFIIKNCYGIITARSRDKFTGENSYSKVAARLCLEYDQKLKSSRTDGYELLLELIFKLSYAGK